MAQRPKGFSAAIFIGTFTPGYKSGGPIRSITHLLNTLPDSERCLIVTADRDLGDYSAYPSVHTTTPTPFGRHAVVYLAKHNPRHWYWLIRLLRRERIATNYVNSFWSPMFSFLPGALCALKVIPGGLIVAPRGELGSGALRLKSRKKRLAFNVWRAVYAFAGASYHATSRIEQGQIHEAFPDARILYQENVPHPPAPEPTPAAPYPRVIFLSRVSPMKNLLFALEALGSTTRPLAVDIFGPIEDERYWEQCIEAIERLPETVTASYRGPVDPGETVNTFAQYDASLFPTLGENHGHAITESFAAGCPVLCSPNTPWTHLLESGAGQVLPLERGVWAIALDHLALLDQTARTRLRHATHHTYRHWQENRARDGEALIRALSRSETDPLRPA